MIVAESVIRELLSARHRRRVLNLPVVTGEFGERVPCPVREGNVRNLTTGTPLAHKRQQAWLMSAGNPARAVLLYIDLIEGRIHTWKQPSVTVTVLAEPFEAGGLWHVPVTLGDKTGHNDRPVFLSAIGDYTFEARLQAVPGDPEVMFPDPGDVARARTRARERRTAPVARSVSAIRADVESCKGVMTTMKAENRRKLIVKELAKLQGEVDAAA